MSPSPVSLSPSSPPTATKPVARAVLVVALIAIFGVFGWLTALGVRPYAGGSDSSGYISEAAMFLKGELSVPQRVVAGMESANGSGYLYVPLGFKPTRSGRLAPTYPPGLPLLYAAGAAVLGERWGVGFVMWLHSMAALALTWLLLVRCRVGDRWSAGALAVFAASPLLLFMTMLAMSDVPSLVWVTAAVLCADASRRRGGWAWGAGFAMSIAVLMRPTNLFAIVPVAVLLGVEWRRWLRVVMAALPAAIFLMALNQHLNGSPFQTGYPPLGDLMGVKYVLPSLGNYAVQLLVTLTPLVVLVLAALKPPQGESRLWVAFAAWAAVYFGFYAFYYCTHETWWYLRYVLPAYPVLVVGMALGAERTLGRLGGWRGVVLGMVVLAGALVWQARQDQRLDALGIGNQERGYAIGCRRAKQIVPPNAIVLTMQTSGALRYYTEFTFMRWDFMQASDFERLTRVATKEGRPLYAVLFPFEIDTVTKQTAGGRWTNVETLGQVSIWRWDR